MNSKIIFGIYDPPKAGLPYLWVILSPKGEVVVTPCKTALEAERHLNEAECQSDYASVRTRLR